MGATYGELAAALVVDTVGSTARRAELGEVAANELDMAERAALRALADDAGGRLVAETGDGAVVILPSASAAVAVALSLRGPQYRIGVAVGEVREVEPGVWTGAALQRAAELERRCPVGEVAAAALVVSLASAAACSVEPLAGGDDGGGVGEAVLVRPSAPAV